MISEHYAENYLRKIVCNFLKIELERRKNQVYMIGHLSIEH